VNSHSQRRDFSLALTAFIIALVLWQMQGLFFLAYPFRLFVTMIHELGHGMAAVLTGGSFVRFEVTRRGAGLAWTSGGSRFFIIQAGYLGTALFGAGLLYLTHRVRRPGRVAIGVGVFIAVLTLAYTGISLSNLSVFETLVAAAVLIAGAYLLLTRDMDAGQHRIGIMILAAGGLLLLTFAGKSSTITILVGLASALCLVGIGLYGSRDLVVVVLTFLAFLTGLQAITDSWVLFKIVSLPHELMPANDASSMAQQFGGSAALWALVWIAMDVLIFGVAVYTVLIRPVRRGAK
jgi:hypothetical protein